MSSSRLIVFLVTVWLWLVHLPFVMNSCMAFCVHFFYSRKTNDVVFSSRLNPVFSAMQISSDPSDSGKSTLLSGLSSPTPRKDKEQARESTVQPPAGGVTAFNVTPTKLTFEQRVEEFRLIIPNSEKAQCNDCEIMVGKRILPYSQRSVLPRASDPVSVSIVTTATRERLAFLPRLLQRWPSYFALALQLKRRERMYAINTINALKLPERVSIVMYYIGDKTNNFFVNKLRNVAIQSIRTTHFLVLDMDAWPMENLYSELLQLPSSILSSSTSAVIVPIFFLSPNAILRNCTSLMQCAIKSEQNFPKNKDELHTCVLRRRCTHMKDKGLQHACAIVVIHGATGPVMKMTCFPNRFQEPFHSMCNVSGSYLFLRYSPDMLLFDERFINYGCNKVQFVDQLRLMGYDFYLLSNSFSMDLVHHDSSYRKGYVSFARAGMSTAMRKLCDVYLAKSERVYGNQTHVAICSHLYE